MDRYIGKKLDGRYQVEELIGIGGMANVYKGFDILENKFVAIKILRDEFSSSEDFLRRFKNESKAIALLSHPNIVEVFDVNITDKTQYIIMEYIDGVTLKEYMLQKGALMWKESLHFIVQILKAIQHAHDMGVVHRDIKPQNIMLLEDGSIKVMDFGIARISRSQSKTMTDKAIGSVHYISPEQARGDSIDSRTDIYSIGVILFEMLTGQLPFQADTAVSVAIKQISDNPMRLRDINPDIPEGLEEITLKAMQKNITKRYQTAASMIVDIDEFKQNPSISFEYKYFQDDQPTRYIDAIKEVKSNDYNDLSQTTNKNKKSSIKSRQTTILLGIASAVVIFASVITYIMLNGGLGLNKKTTVPKFVGQKIDDVQRENSYKDFKIKIDEENSSEVEKGKIISQSIDEGRNVTKGTEITLKVSLGVKKVKVPNVKNKDYQIAESMIKEVGLKSEFKYEFSDVVAKNSVIETDPKDNTELDMGDTVIIKVSNGAEPKKINVPDLVGKTLDEAKKLIEESGLKLGSINIVASNQKENTIVSQNPAKNSSVDKDTSVNLNVSNGVNFEKNMDITIPLSDYKETSSGTVKIEAFLDGIRVKSEQILIKDLKTWKFTLKGTGTKTLKILIEDKLYKEYKLNFDNSSMTPN